jgi:hypothetical protein
MVRTFIGGSPKNQRILQRTCRANVGHSFTCEGECGIPEIIENRGYCFCHKCLTGGQDCTCVGCYGYPFKIFNEKRKCKSRFSK